MEKAKIDLIDRQYDSLTLEEKQRIYSLYLSDDESINNIKKQLQLLIFKWKEIMRLI